MRLLLVTSSPRGDAAASTALAEAWIAEHHPDAEVDRLDAFDLAPFGPHHAAAKIAVIMGEEPAPEDAAAWDDVLSVVERVRAADVLVLAVPVWNHGVPWALKLFIDTVTQPGLTFAFDPATGYTGLLGGRRAVTAYASGVWAPGVDAAFGTDQATPYVRSWLEFVGIDQVEEVRTHPSYDAVAA